MNLYDNKLEAMLYLDYIAKHVKKGVNVTNILERSTEGLAAWPWPLVATINAGPCLTPTLLQSLDFLWPLAIQCIQSSPSY